LRQGNPVYLLIKLRDRGWQLLDCKAWHESRVALAVYDTCSECVGRLLGNKHVRHLREAKGRAR
jgi:hypothetical protein